MRILVVEDDKVTAAFLKKVLSEESYAVDIAMDGKRGEDLAISEVYDLIILDIVLPGQDGLTLLTNLRKQNLTTPILLLTARSEVPDRVTGLDSGADDYLAKPFAITELRARVRALLRRQAPEKSAIMQSGTLSLNTITHQVKVGGKPLDLTNREFAILRYLLKNKNRLISKSMIADHVWDYHFNFNKNFNLIEVYIRSLRKKIKRHNAQQVIYTVRNGGYIIRDPQ